MKWRRIRIRRILLRLFQAVAAVQGATLLALAAKELAGNLPEIGSITLTPDLIQPILQRLAR